MLGARLSVVLLWIMLSVCTVRDTHSVSILESCQVITRDLSVYFLSYIGLPNV